LLIQLEFLPAALYSFNMSFAEILDELPSLTLAERRELCRRTLALEPAADELAHCDLLAAEAMQDLDRIEEKTHRNANTPGSSTPR
jgi:hypothetical protein